MAINYTPSQSRAIHTTGKSILVSAAAGSGKTAVLVQRIIEMVCQENGPDIDRLLVVTFTNAAAAEMKDKIYKEIILRLSREPENKKLKRQILLMPGANIQTIHGFCLNVIKNNINMLDLPVKFRVADDAECNILMKKCLTELVEDHYEAEDEDFLFLADTYGFGRDDELIHKLIQNCYNFTTSMADPDAYYDHCINLATKVTQNFSESVYAKFLMRRLYELLEEHESNYQLALEDIQNHPDLSAYSALFLEEHQFICNLMQETDFENMMHLIDTFSFANLAHVKGKVRGADNSFIKSVREIFKSDYEKFCTLLGNSVESEKRDTTSIIRYIKILTKLTKEFSSRYQQEKRKRSVLDFSDFEHFALRILSDDCGNPSETAIGYRERFYEILIDEYQDTNDIQDHIFRLISQNGENLFLVGDVKQSIYGFRQAKPQIFMEKQETYHDNTHEVIFLANNFRSRKEVVDSVNAVFSKTMTPKISGTNYEKEALVQSAPYEDNDKTNYQTEILFFDKAQKTEHPNDEDDDDILDNESIMIAKRIHEIVNIEKTQVFNLKTRQFHDATYGDIVILVRSMKDFTRKLYQTLVDHGIPVNVNFSENLFSSVEIKVSLSILKAIDNPYDDMALLALLKSPIFHWNEDEIFRVRNLSVTKPFFCAIQSDESDNSKAVVSFLNDMRHLGYCGKLATLLDTIYQTYHLKDLFCVYRNPEQRMENLDILYHMALSYDHTDIGGLKGFLGYMEHIISTQSSIPAYREQPPANCVQIVTMHKSKGLEYPIVFVAGLGKAFHQDEVKWSTVFHSDYGIGANYIDYAHRFTYPTLTKKAVLAVMKEEALNEEMRTLYVALTRAKEKLILTASVSNLLKSYSRWEHIQKTSGMTKNRIFNASGFIDYIMPCILGNKAFQIKVYKADDFLEQDKSMQTVTEEARRFEDSNYLFLPYPHQELTKLPSKVAVTEANRLAKRDAPARSVVLSDLDTLEEKFSASEYGTYFHKVFECVDLDAIRNGLDVSLAIKNAVQSAGEREYSLEIFEKVLAFFTTDFAKELLNADVIHREKSFLVRVPANMVYPVETDELMLLQGTTDCYFIKNDTITLLDFKTDRNPDEAAIRKNYAKQMELYGYALEKAEGRKVVKKVIYTAVNQQFIIF